MNIPTTYTLPDIKGAGLLNLFLPYRHFAQFSASPKHTLAIEYPNLYLAGVTAAEPRCHLPNMNVTQRISRMLL